MKIPFFKSELKEYFYLKYRPIINLINNLNKSGLPLKVPNMSGDVGEHLAYYLIIDKVISIFDVGEIKYVELRGDTKSGPQENGEVGGDIVIECMDGKTYVIEVKIYTHKSGFTNKSVNNKKADFWILMDAHFFREGNDIIEVSVIKNFNKYSKTVHMEGNDEDKMFLTSIIKTAKEGGDDYLSVKSVDLKTYFSNKEGESIRAHENEYFSWN